MDDKLLVLVKLFTHGAGTFVAENTIIQYERNVMGKLVKCESSIMCFSASSCLNFLFGVNKPRNFLHLTLNSLSANVTILTE